ncbi:hypothetical protein BC835DRAFT_1270412 [Cytidiella melzeri]|nr:hypothetical protein BC835DRAFT_1270412 [Cytidiella melzeri]
MNGHTDLHALRSQLRDVYASITTFRPPVAHPPIIDSSVDLVNGDGPRQDSVRGLRKLKESVRRDLDILEKFLANPNNAGAPALSTNAPYLIAVWKEVLHAEHPVVAVWDTYSEHGTPLHPRRRNTPKEAGVKVDVVADGGRHWTRVNTTKNSRLLAEFREIDSFLTESESDEDEDDSAHHLPTSAQKDFDNTVLRMGKSLLAAARENPLPGTMKIPTITMRLTRLKPFPTDEKEHDPRIAQTIQELRDLGIDVRLGEHRDPVAVTEAEVNTVHAAPPWKPTMSINLDLSALIAIVSDLTHAPLSTSTEDSETRFTHSLQWKNRHADDQTGEARPSRALIQQALQEMEHSLFQEISDRTSHSATTSQLEFWTTPEARDRCLQIVGTVGGSREKRRAEILFAAHTDLEQAEKDFWRNSRYPTGYIPLLPVRLLPSGEPKQSITSREFLSPFFLSLAKTCCDILAQETIPLPDPFLGGEDEIQRAAVMRPSTRLTAHTVRSMLWGATKGWTTLTANKTSVKALLKDLRAARNGALWDENDTQGLKEYPSEVAAIWIVDPRSLAEGMQADIR